MNKNTKKTVLCLVTMALCILLFCVRITGEIVHMVLGTLLLLIIIIHIIRNRKKMNYVQPKYRLVNLILIGTMLVLFLFGILSHPFGEFIIFKIVHKLAAVIFLIGCLVHVLLHRQMGRKRKDVS